MDWHSRKVLSWRLSNTLDTGFCVEARRNYARFWCMSAGAGVEKAAYLC